MCDSVRKACIIALSLVFQHGAEAEWNDSQCTFQEALGALRKNLVRPTRKEEAKKAQASRESGARSAPACGRPTETSSKVPYLQV